MKIELMERQAKHVHIFWKETLTELLRGLFPFTIKNEAEALSLFEATQLDLGLSNNIPFMKTVWIQCSFKSIFLNKRTR